MACLKVMLHKEWMYDVQARGLNCTMFRPVLEYPFRPAIKKNSKYYTKYGWCLQKKSKYYTELKKNSKYYTEFHTKILSTAPSPTGVQKNSSTTPSPNDVRSCWKSKSESTTYQVQHKNSKYYTKSNWCFKKFKLQHQVGLRLVFNKNSKYYTTPSPSGSTPPDSAKEFKVLHQL